LPVLPIRNAVLFPSISMPLVVGRPRSLRALNRASELNNLLVIVTQKIITSSDPAATDLYQVGSLCKIEDQTTTENGSQQIVVTGLSRYKAADFFLSSLEDSSYLAVRGHIVDDTHAPDLIRNEALLNNLKVLAQDVLELLPGASEPLVQLLERVDDPSYLTNICAAYLNLSLNQKQELLETVEIERRIEVLLNYMQREREVLNLQREIRNKMSERINKGQREALLREQLRTIRAELGEEANDENTDDLEEKLRRADLSEEAAKQASDELRRLRSLPVASAEYHVVRTYIEWLASLPWRKASRDNINIWNAKKILDEDHFGLDSVKRRILQFLAVAKLKNDLRGPILCLVGPPGVGKTSLGQSIARTLGRKFIRTSLGGVRDEAEIRGHRRTYVGAMPGRIIQTIKRVGTKNPVMMLDEIDKLRADFHGDPSAAMLEVLDPEQNKSFTDHYLDLPFDLSEVFFITTANVLDTIPAPLRDRMEIIEVNGYTSVEKMQIAKNFIVPKEFSAHGIKPNQVSIPDQTLVEIITKYTREAGVRELQRKIAGLLRAAAEEIVQKSAKNEIEMSPDKLPSILGPEKFYSELAQMTSSPGIATALAWTPNGGDILFIETTSMPGKGGLILTGQLGDVMKESAQLALSLARSNFYVLQRAFDFSLHDIHIHIPGGAIPKDGPSAGVTILMSLISLLLNRTIDPKLAMTGEITLRGAVLPVGGIKEKIIAAHRAGLQKVILPKKNEQDLQEVPAYVRDKLSYIYIEHIDQLFKSVFRLEKSDKEQHVSLQQIVS